ncbi:MAG: hypothetical protein HC767_14815 [Akkermansiaceae bacterium]|nr:hypothetical protein [Akkermansiaceae bacterium]
MADAKELEARNPALQGQLSKEEKFYLFDAGLVVITADGQRFRVRAPDFKTEPYTPVDDRHFSWMKMMATQWNGGYQTNDFLCHTAMIDGKWLGLLSEKTLPIREMMGSRITLNVPTQKAKAHAAPSGEHAMDGPRNCPKAPTNALPIPSRPPALRLI